MPDWKTLAPGLTRRQRWFYQFFESTARLAMIVFYRWHSVGRQNVPPSGPLLVVANHQSYLDSTCVGCGLTPRVAVHVARSGLYKRGFFSWLIARLNTIPIRSEGGDGDTGAMKEIIRRLAEGNCVILFPEGSRSEDGRMAAFKPGVALIIKRAGCPVLPAAIEGAFDAWPRGSKAPRLFGHRLAVKYGTPIPAAELFKDGTRGSLHRLEREVDTLRLDLRGSLRQRSRGRFPPGGPGDSPSFAAPAEPTEAGGAI